MRDFVIVLPTHSDYKDVVENFLQLLRKNWQNCPYTIVVSVTGVPIKINGTVCLYNGKNASLIECLKNVTKKYKSKYYINFLGDAFISKKIDDVTVLRILNELAKNDICYCSLDFVKNYTKRKDFNKELRYINNLDRYSHNFTAFVASYEYINNEMTKFKTDLEYEKHYLQKDNSFYFEKHLIVKRNYFNLLPSITKGKWDKINYNKLKRENPEIMFSKRCEHTWLNSLVYHTRNRTIHLMPNSLRIYAKRIIKKTVGTEFGVEG